MGELPADLVARLIEHHRDNAHLDIVAAALRDRAARGLQSGDEAYLQETYAQVPLQACTAGSFAGSASADLMVEIESCLGPLRRTRISALAPCAKVPRHIDDPDQLRVISLLHGEQEMVLFQPQGELHLAMGEGELWFVNTSWEHSVRNPGASTRLALLADLAEIPAALDV